MTPPPLDPPRWSIRTVWIPAVVTGLVWLALPLHLVAHLAWIDPGPHPTGSPGILASMMWVDNPRSLSLSIAAVVTPVALVMLSLGWLRRVRAGPRRVFLGTWATAITAGALVIGCAYLGSVLDPTTHPGDLGLAKGLRLSVVPAAHWMVLCGWIPALIATQLADGAGQHPRPRSAVPLMSVAALLALAGTTVMILQGRASSESAVDWAYEPVASASATDSCDPPDYPSPTATYRVSIWESAESYPPRNRCRTPPPPLPSGEPVAECSSELVMTGAGGDATMGWRMLLIEATNTSDHYCTYGGYPTLSFATADGTPLPVNALDGGGRLREAGPQDYQIAPGSHLYFAMEWRMNSIGSRDSVGIVTVTPGPNAAPAEVHIGLDIIADARVNITAWSRSVPRA